MTVATRVSDELQELVAAVEQSSDATRQLSDSIPDILHATTRNKHLSAALQAQVMSRVASRKQLRMALELTTTIATSISLRHLDIELSVEQSHLTGATLRFLQRALGARQGSFGIRPASVTVSLAPADAMRQRPAASNQLEVYADCLFLAPDDTVIGTGALSLVLGIHVALGVATVYLASSLQLIDAPLSNRAASAMERTLELEVRKASSSIELPTLPLSRLATSAVTLTGTRNCKGALTLLAEMAPHDPITYVPLQPSVSQPPDEAIAIRINMHALGDAFEEVARKALDEALRQHPDFSVIQHYRAYGPSADGSRAGVWFWWLLHSGKDGADINIPINVLIELDADGNPLVAQLRLYYMTIKWLSERFSGSSARRALGAA